MKKLTLVIFLLFNLSLLAKQYDYQVAKFNIGDADYGNWRQNGIEIYKVIDLKAIIAIKAKKKYYIKSVIPIQNFEFIIIFEKEITKYR